MTTDTIPRTDSPEAKKTAIVDVIVPMYNSASPARRTP